MSIGGLLEAFIALRPALLRYLSLRGASADEAEDVLQDVGLKLSKGGIAPVEQTRAYLYRMAHNHFLLHRRTHVRRVGREEAWSDVNGGDQPEIDQSPSAETAMAARQMLSILQQVIDGLPERTRMIFRRFRVDNVTQRQIAQELGISVSAVEKHLMRAYAAIGREKKRLNEDIVPSRSLFSGGKREP